MAELLAIIGSSWQPLLLYPGVLAGILTTLVMRGIWHMGRRNGSVLIRPAWDPSGPPAIAALLLGMALLPLPRTYWAYPVDVLGVLVLLEAPYWLYLGRRLRAADHEVRLGATREAAALLNVYVLLTLAAAALGQAAGSLLLPDLKRGEPLLRWTGLVAWSIALPPLVGLGPWYVPANDGWLPALRRVAHIALLVSLALPAGDRWGHTASAIGALCGFGSLTLLHLLWHGPPARWERLQPAVALIVLIVLLASAAQAWLARLR